MKGHQSGEILASAFKLKHVFDSFEEIWEIVFVYYQMKTIFMKCPHFSSLQLGIFFPKLGKKSPRFYWERGRISAPEDTKKNPCMLILPEYSGYCTSLVRMFFPPKIILKN